LCSVVSSSIDDNDHYIASLIVKCSPCQNDHVLQEILLKLIVITPNHHPFHCRCRTIFFKPRVSNTRELPGSVCVSGRLTGFDFVGIAWAFQKRREMCPYQCMIRGPLTRNTIRRVSGKGFTHPTPESDRLIVQQNRAMTYDHSAVPGNQEQQLYSAPMYDQEKNQQVPFRRRISKKCWWCIGIAGVIVLAAVVAIAVALALRENNDEWKKNNP